ncbi:MAG: hypothetical protein UY62_C0042G0005 [Parcubacteria group bacterium GW2011_GWF2_50_9]|nr:MAG: hypothetical protein UY62_C0042G0005 [Parcubacteria group bacterium GW2011_GWF2_50_9]
MKLLVVKAQSTLKEMKYEICTFLSITLKSVRVYVVYNLPTTKTVEYSAKFILQRGVSLFIFYECNN